MLFGSSAISKLMLGASEVDKVYLGTSEAYTRFQPDPYMSDVSLLLSMDGETVTDSSLYARTVTAVGNAATSASQKKFGARSLALDGTGDYINTNAPFSSLLSASGNFVFEAWVYPVAVAAGAIMSNREETEGVRGLSLFLDSSNYPTLRTVDGNSTTTAAGTSAVPAGAWSHIALARTSNSLRLYVNGSLATTHTSSASFSGSQPVTIGSDAAAGGTAAPAVAAFSGYIDEVRFTANSNRGYTGSSITVPTAAYPSYGITTDPLWTRVQMLLHLNNSAANTGYLSSNTATLVSPSSGDAQYLSGAAKFGTHGVRLSGTPSGSVETNDQAYGRLILNDGLGAITPSWTFEAWIKPATTWSSGTRVIASGGDRYYTLWDIKAVNQTVVFAVNVSALDGGTLSGTATAAISGGLSAAWHHIAATRDFGSMKLYVDGALLGTATLTGSESVFGTIGSNTALAIGAGYDAMNTNWLNGAAMDIDEVRVTHAARQISAAPTAEFPEG